MAAEKISVDVDTGRYTTRVITNSPYYNAVPVSFNTNRATYFNNDTLLFAVQPIKGKRDLAVSLTSLNIARPGFTHTYRLTYRNIGTDTLVTGFAEMIKDSKQNFISASRNYP